MEVMAVRFFKLDLLEISLTLQPKSILCELRGDLRSQDSPCGLQIGGQEPETNLSRLEIVYYGLRQLLSRHVTLDARITSYYGP